MANVPLTAEQIQASVAPLIGLPVSRPWKGYGSSIFLELGPITLRGNGATYEHGEAYIRVFWDWRVEFGNKVLWGSSNSNPEIATHLLSLGGLSLTAVSVEGCVPELVVLFSNGHCLRSMLMVDGYPQWAIRLLDGRYLHAEAGFCQIVSASEVSAVLSDEERATFDQAAAAAQRWGTPTSSPSLGACRDCACYVRLDGQGHLLDYGVCTAAEGPLDGRVVHRRSSCSRFTPSGDA